MTIPAPAHTPGPWHVSGFVDRAAGEANLHIGAASSPMALASMNSCHIDTEANARLIAAAPALVAALQEAAAGYSAAIAVIRASKIVWMGEDAAVERLERMASALSLALGEQ